MSSGQIPAEFLNPSNGTNMTSSNEKAEKMDTDGQNEDSDAQEQKQNVDGEPIEEVLSKCCAIYFPF